MMNTPEKYYPEIFSICKWIQSLLTFGFLVLSASCEKIIDMPIQEKERKIVMNGILNPDSSIYLHLSYSQGILERDSLIHYNNARVEWLEDDISQGFLDASGKGVYSLNAKPVPGKKYSFRLENPQGNYTQCENIIPHVPVFSIADTFTKTMNEGFGWWTEQFNLDLRIQDDEKEKNFYFLRIWKEQIYYLEPDSIPSSFGSYQEIITESPLVEITENHDTYQIQESKRDIILTGSGKSYVYGTGFIFSDASFNGKEFVFPVAFDKYFFGTRVRFVIEILSLHEDFFRYMKSQAMKTGEIDIFSEKVKIFSNVENGFGLLGSYAQSSTELVMEKPKIK